MLGAEGEPRPWRPLLSARDLREPSRHAGQLGVDDPLGCYLPACADRGMAYGHGAPVVEGGERTLSNAQSELGFRYQRADDRRYHPYCQIPKQTQ